MNDRRRKAKQESLSAEGASDRQFTGSGALRWLLVGLLLLVVASLTVATILRRSSTSTRENRTQHGVSPRSAAKHPPLPQVQFTEITQQAGIAFVHENGAYGEKLLPETMGGGCAFFDFDNDGDQDLLLVNSMGWPFDPRPAAADEPALMALYENDGRGRFHDVTASRGLDVPLYGMGVAVGDYDNDGDGDLFFSAVGKNRLFENRQGDFYEVTDLAGVGGEPQSWSTGCGWLDYNNDGLLDLFVCNYVQWSREIDRSQHFQLAGVGRAYGPPTSFDGSFSYLYRNEGGGRFTDVSAEAGIQIRHPQTGLPLGKSLGIVFTDIDMDGQIDIVVANDTVQNFLLRNKGDGTFEEIARPSGIAFDREGQARGAMGIDAGYFRNSPQLGLAIGNFANEMSALYAKEPDAPVFVDAAIATGFGPSTRTELTFGIFFFDYDLDGRLDILSANGHLEEQINRVIKSQYYEQPPQLFWNAGRGGLEYVRVPEEIVGADFVRPLVGRGAAYADIDGDGDLDVLLTSCGGPPRLLRNDQALQHHWLRVTLIGTHCNRDAIGARIALHRGQITQYAEVSPTRSYLSQVEKSVTFGLGSNESVERIVVRWPDGSQQEISHPPIDQEIVITQFATDDGE